ncbi:site-specific integrase [Bacteroides fragilis]|uniref:site-specific integrase n=1 Tax=Bacteroides fragilis TaxID=817 RepID=UPI0020300659|nr:site-specific integrase [Bacteroides fragilis]MCM0275920.1 site-specific integrase [Bacteroides fragilis]
MKNQLQKINILFWLFKSRGNEFGAPLRCRVSIMQQRYEISLNYTVPFKLWVADAQRCKQSTALGKEINQAIDQLRAEIETGVEQLRAEGAPITIENLKLKLFQTGEVEGHRTVLAMFEYHKVIESHIAKSTMTLYNVTRDHVAKFMRIRYSRVDMDIRKVKRDFAIEFFAYLQGYKRPMGETACQNNTAIKHMQRIGHVFNMAFENEWIDKNPFVRFHMQTRATERGFLDMKEVERVQALRNLTPKQIIIRDMFIFSVYTGISFIDICNLKADNVHLGIDGEQWLIYKRMKTDIRCMIPLLEPAEEILTRYQNASEYIKGNPLLPIPTNQECNRALKVIASLANIHKNVTFHMARHTFATTITLSNNVPIESVSAMMGHANMATTQIYAKVVGEKISRDTQVLRKLFSSNKHEVRQIINQ